MKKLLLFLLFAAVLSLRADVIYSRHGKIVAAEITSAIPYINGLDEKFAFPSLPERRLYAAVSIKLSAGRRISIFDYSLEAFGKTFPCVAINTGSYFESTDRTLPGTDRPIQLLFIIDKQQLNASESLKFKCNLPPHNGTYDLLVDFSNLRNTQLTAPGSIPEAGLIGNSAK